jgi:RNA polymerase sigma-70 factor, ECF subfamily
LLWYQHTDAEAVRAINRVETNDDGITRLRNYFYTPDFIAEVCGELGVPCRSNGNRYWLYNCGVAS